MRFEVMLILDTELPPQQLLSEIVSNLESLPSETRTAVDAGCVLLDGEQVAIYDGKERT